MKLYEYKGLAGFRLGDFIDEEGFKKTNIEKMCVRKAR